MGIQEVTRNEPDDLFGSIFFIRLFHILGGHLFIHCNTPCIVSLSATSLQFVLHIVHLITVLRFDVP